MVSIINFTNKLKSGSKKKGFTLVELIVVILIITILAAATFLGGATIIKQARITKVINDLEMYSSCMENMFFNNPTYASENVTNAVSAANKYLTSDIAISGNGKTGTSASLRDPWNNAYGFIYEKSSENTCAAVLIWSNGPDGVSNSSLTKVTPNVSGDDMAVIIKITSGEVTVESVGYENDNKTQGEESALQIIANDNNEPYNGLEDVSFTINVENDRIKRIEIDGVQIDEYDGIETKDNATVIIIEKDYFNSLNDGVHNINVESDMDSVSMSFIKKTNGYVIPDGCTYITKGSTSLIYNAGEKMPADYIAKIGDKLVNSDYTYRYNERYDKNESGEMAWVTDKTMNGWGIRVNNSAKAYYIPLEQNIAGMSVVSLSCTFLGCENLEGAPEIPYAIKDMQRTFYGCSNLTMTPEIPNRVKDMYATFYGCTNLMTTPEIPNSVENMSFTFCGCEKLIIAPKLQNGVTNIESICNGCVSLISSTEIPNSVTNMDSAFRGCSNMESIPMISENVTNMANAFAGCAKLSGRILINANPVKYDNCFKDTVCKININGMSEVLEDLMKTANNNNVSVK